MPDAHSFLIITIVSLGLAATPGANMAYLMSRSIAQGPRAGFFSLAGTNAAMLAVMLASVAGLAGVLRAMPHLWETIRLLGAAGLLYLAWGYLKPGGHGLAGHAGEEPPRDPPARLFALGFTTAALNPKVALFYLAGLPHLVHARAGASHAAIVEQGVVLGLTQVGINLLCDIGIVLGADRLARLLRRRPALATAQRYAVGGALGLVGAALMAEAIG